MNSSPLYSFSDDLRCGGIGNQYRDSGGSPVALGSAGAHGVWVKLVNPQRGPAPLTEIQILTDTIKYR